MESYMKEIYNQNNIENWERKEILKTNKISNFSDKDSFVTYLQFLEWLEKNHDLSSNGTIRMNITKKILYGEPLNANK
jgi:hypothetical protein